MKKKYIPLLLLLLSYHLYNGQSNSTTDYTLNTNDAGRNIPKILPATPESFKFSQYGNIPVGLFTGSPNINVPLSQFTSGDIQIPISLNYSSNGINVDEMNGSVGLGWTFISGGVITRTIRDKADEKSGYGSGDVPLLEGSSSEMTEYLKFCEVDDFDSERDLYTANFAGNNVKFLISKSGNIIMIDQKDYQIKKNDAGNLFSIILDNGIRYNFNEIENVINKTLNVGGHQIPTQYPQAWYLTSVVDTKGNTVNLEYNDVTYTNVISQSQSMAYTTGTQWKYGASNTGANGGTYCPMENYVILPELGLIADSQQTVFGKQIKKIYDSNYNSITFTYSPQSEDYPKLTNIKKVHGDNVIEDISFNYLSTTTSRLFLTEVHDNKNNSSHKFSYYNPESFPKRLSFSRDMWGHYNGKNNSSLVPQLFESDNTYAPQYSGADQSVNSSVGYYGLLKTVTYPTGGNTLLNYENHKRKGTIKIPGQKTDVGISTYNTTNSGSTSTKEIIITPQKTADVRVGVASYLYEMGTCANSPTLETLKQRAEIQVQDVTTGSYLPLALWDQASHIYIPQGTSYSIKVGNSAFLDVSGTKGRPLKIILTARFACSDAYATAQYYTSDDSFIEGDILLGGYRIASTVDSTGDGVPVTRKYNYVKDNGLYSINVVSEPIFKESRTVGSTCNVLAQAQPIFLNYTSITSSNIGRLNSFSPNIFYDTVEEEIEGKGKIIHHFGSVQDYLGSPIRGSWIMTSPATNAGWNNGKELLTVYKDQNNTILKTVENNFVEDASRTFYLGAISRRKIFEPVLSNDTWNNFENLDATYYKNISRFTYLQSQKSTDYFNGVPVKTETEYFYNNPLHHQLTSQKVTDPDLSIETTSYAYAHEKSNQKLINANIVGVPLETTKILKESASASDVIVLKEETKYDDASHLFPTSVISQNLLTPATLTTEITYDQYDSKGNLQQYTTKDGVPVAIVWGYNQAKPIAKVEGATYAQVSSLASAIITASNTDASAATNNDETALLAALDTFRKNTALSGYQVSTYTYDPLIGVRSITPPSGIRELYQYDSANRLEKIIDINGKIIKEYKYNFKN
ncbi:hypothetical protein [Chryseobacterium sp. CT-SW4]|uniref:hypothetical protein n=1 Tax=Chryseobacterium sp. SW-1 TaxID=3157343 RepID=UPI003B012778